MRKCSVHFMTRRRMSAVFNSEPAAAAGNYSLNKAAPGIFMNSGVIRTHTNAVRRSDTPRIHHLSIYA